MKNYKKGIFSMSKTDNDTKSRKYQLTINNPHEFNISHETINNTMREISCEYYCLCDEIGKEGTLHTHIFFSCKNAIRFSRVKKLFPTAHIESARGSCQENIDYIRKEGKYLDSEKKETNLIETFEEYGEIPLDRLAKNIKVSEQLFEMLENESSMGEILKRFPSYATRVSQLEKAQQVLLEEKYSNDWRDIEVTYISGETATGKTRYVMEKYGYSNVYKVTNYKNPFDSYRGEKVILFDEFRSSIPLTDMLQYLDGYPCRLPARFADKTACYTKAYIVSNIDLDRQYPNMQNDDILSWNAFLRRITSIKKFVRNNGDLPFASNEEIVVIDLMVDDFLK